MQIAPLNLTIHFQLQKKKKIKILQLISTNSSANNLIPN